MRYRLSSPLLFAAIVTLVVVGGCDAVRDAWNDPQLESRLRDEAGREGKVGTVRALEVRRTAIGLTASLQRPLTPECELELEPGQARRAHIVIERARGDDTLMRWEEERTLHRDVDAARLDWSAEFATLADTRGELVGAAIATSQGGWVGRPPGPAFFARDDLTQADVIAQFTDPLDGLLRLASWRRDGPGRWVAGSEPLRCAEADHASAWMSRIAANGGKLVSQRFETAPDRARRLELTWVFDDQTELRVEWREEVVTAVAVGGPPADAIVDVERDLSYKSGHQDLRRWLDEGLVDSVESPRPDGDQ